MKKKIGSVLLFVTMSFALVACGKEAADTTTGTETGTQSEAEVSEEATVELNAQETADTILSEGDFVDKLAEVDNTVALTRLYNLDSTQIEESAFYTNTNATAEEIAVIRASSEEYVEAVRDAYQARINSQYTACKDYLPDELPKLDSAVIYSSGRTVVLCISNNNTQAKELIEQLIK